MCLCATQLSVNSLYSCTNIKYLLELKMQFVTFWNFLYLDASYFNCVDNSMSTNCNVWLRYKVNPDNHNTGQKTVNKNIRKGYSFDKAQSILMGLESGNVEQFKLKTDTLIWRGIGYLLLSHLCSLLHNKALLATAQGKGTWCPVSFALWSIRLSLLGKCNIANAFDDRNDDSL